MQLRKQALLVWVTVLALLLESAALRTRYYDADEDHAELSQKFKQYEADIGQLSQ